MGFLKKAIKNSFVGGIGFVLNLINSIALVPLFLKYWGTERYSDWLTIQAIFAIFQLFDVGHRSYVSIELNMWYHKNFDHARTLLSTSLFYSVLISCFPVILFTFFYFTGLFDVFFGINTSTVSGNQLFIGLLLMQIFNVFSGNTIAILISLMYPLDKLYQSQLFGLFSTTITTLMLILVAFLDLPIVNAVIVYCTAQLLISLITFLYVKKQASVFFPLKHSIDFKLGLQNLYKSFYVSLNALMTQFSQNGLILVLSNLGLSTVIPKFTSVKTIGNLSTKVSAIFATATVLDLAKYHIANETKKINSVLQFNWIISGLIFNLTLLLVDPFIEPLYLQWTQGVLAFDRILYLLIVVSASFVNYGFILGQYFVVINDVKNQNYTLILKSIGLFLPIILTYRILGMYSIGVGLIVSELLGSILLPAILVSRFTVFKEQVKFPYKEFYFSLLPLVILLSYYSTTLAIGFTYWIYLIFVFVLIFSYFLNWRILDSTIRDKILRRNS